MYEWVAALSDPFQHLKEFSCLFNIMFAFCHNQEERKVKLNLPKYLCLTSKHFLLPIIYLFV